MSELSYGEMYFADRNRRVLERIRLIMREEKCDGSEIERAVRAVEQELKPKRAQEGGDEPCQN
jgi:hypothetical protein